MSLPDEKREAIRSVWLRSTHRSAGATEASSVPETTGSGEVP